MAQENCSILNTFALKANPCNFAQDRNKGFQQQ